jgi:high affinity Mn2+ porin
LKKKQFSHHHCKDLIASIRFSRVAYLLLRSYFYYTSMKGKYFILLLLITGFKAGAQIIKDTSFQKNWYLHLQLTSIPQYHFNFKAGYTGANSLLTKEPAKISLTNTYYIGRRLWKNAAIYFNAEIAGGEGFSKTLGISGFPNGETFRIGSPTPQLYIARAYFEQKFPLTNARTLVESDINQLRAYEANEYIAFRFGKFSIADFFDDNNYSHDPRTDFMNWALMSAAAWDYPANTRGYTKGLVLELKKSKWAIRAAINMEPFIANGPVLDTKINKAFGTVLELEKSIQWNKQYITVLRIAGFYNQANMGNYNEAIQIGLANATTPDIVGTRQYGRTKSGWYFNAEHNLKQGGAFFRYSWNDGNNETWAFTEIDRSATAGISLDGKNWHRKNDKWGLAYINNAIAQPHRNYLKNGGYGFMIGDGNLNYGTENIVELFYSYGLPALHLNISPDYQFIVNPAYNKDRGPVHAIGLRVHFEF